MVASSVSVDPGFSPIDRPRIAVSPDGTLAAVVEATRVVVLEVSGAAAVGEVGVDGAAQATETAWVGAPPRLLVLSRFTAHTTVHLIDPHGPRTIAEIRLESPMRLFASVGSHALAVSAMGAAVLSAGGAHLTPYQFPARSLPLTAGAAGNHFMVALAGQIEEWDPASRMPKRRLKLPRPAVITALGGSDRVVWMTTLQDPTRLDVLPLVNRGQPRFHELPEPIAHASGHPRSDLVVCLGADSGRLYVVDLDGRTRLRVIEAPGLDRPDAAALVMGRGTGVLAAQACRPVTLILFEPREPEAPPARESEPVLAPTMAVTAASVFEPEPEVAASTLLDEAPRPVSPVVAPALAPVAPTSAVTVDASAPASRAAALPTAAVAQNLADRFSAWRDRMRQPQPRSEAGAVPWAEARPSWRDEVVAWARAVAAGSVDRGAPPAPPIEALVRRFELPPPLTAALVLLYGAHLAGEGGAAPVDVARVLGRRWDEALGTGTLAQRGLVSHGGSRVRLAPPIERALDELPPATGVLVGEAGQTALLGPCVVVAGDEPLVDIATRCLAAVGAAILVGRPGVHVPELLLEARARGPRRCCASRSTTCWSSGTTPRSWWSPTRRSRTSSSCRAWPDRQPLVPTTSSRR